MTRVMAATAFSTIWKLPQRNTRYEGISRSRAIAVAWSKRFHWMGCSLRVWLDAKVVTVIRTRELWLSTIHIEWKELLRVSQLQTVETLGE